MVERADIIIIGGGIAGISAAARLVANATLVVLEQETSPGTHATGRSAATYIRSYGNSTLRALNAASHADLASPPSDLAERTLLSPRGLLYVATADQGNALDQEMDGIEGLSEISLDEAAEHFPILDPGSLARAAYEPDASDIDVDLLFQGFLRQIRTAGGRLITNAKVTAMSRAGSQWHVQTPAGAFEAPVVIDAAGAWADHVATLAGVPSKQLVPKRRSAATLPPPEEYNIAQWPLVASISEEWYTKPVAGRLLVSPADQDPVEPMDAWPDEMVLAEGLDRFERSTTIKVSRVEHKWAGLRTFAPDKSPVVGFDDAAPGFFWLAGQGGYGIQTSPALSRIAADLILTGTTDVVAPEVLDNIRPGREALN
ncbi:MAG: FAD-binding oxidoreductase [Pseudomonadota bacterium]